MFTAIDIFKLFPQHAKYEFVMFFLFLFLTTLSFEYSSENLLSVAINYSNTKVNVQKKFK